VPLVSKLAEHHWVLPLHFHAKVWGISRKESSQGMYEVPEKTWRIKKGSLKITENRPKRVAC
jgi:hypothetical protein